MTEPITSLPSTRIIELFSRDPIGPDGQLSLSPAERAEIVEALRAQRGAWAEKEARPKATRGRGTSRAKTPRPEKLSLDMLGDLKL